MDYTSEIGDLLSRHGFRRFSMARSPVGHLKLVGHFDGRPIDIVVDTGSSKTFVELSYCRSEGMKVTDTGQPGRGGTIHTLDGVQLTLDGLPIRTDGILALDMSSTNQVLAMRGVDPIRAIIGQDVLRHHQAVIDYATLSLFLNERPVEQSRAADASALAALLSRHGFRRFMMTRTKFGHVQLVGQIAGRTLDIVLDTGAGNSFVELDYCRSEGISVTDTGRPGQDGNVHTLGDVQLMIDGMQVRTDGIFAIALTATNQRLIGKGADPIRACIGQDILRHHRAVIDYAAPALFLEEDPA